MEIQTFITTLSEKKEIADNVLELRFEKPEGFEYQAGQFVQFFIPGEEKSTPRSYSISSTPKDDYLEFCVKILEGGLASSHFSSMNVGDTLEMRGPRGRFILNPEASSHMFLATGAGLAPIMGMLLEELKNNGSQKPVSLLFGVRSEKDVFWTERLDELKKVHENFSYTLCLSKPEDIESCNAVEGRVTGHLPESFDGVHVYLCGSGEMVMEVRKAAIERGADAKAIHFEIF